MKHIWKLLFIGAPGSGKTTCIAAVSDIDPVSTDVECTDELALKKPTTTVALDYGELNLGDQGTLLLYGLPGQSRFKFMFEVVREGLLGVAILVDGKAADPIAGLRETLNCYADEIRELPLVLCLNKTAVDPYRLLSRCIELMREYGLVAPALPIDARRREDVVYVFELLFLLLQQSALDLPLLEKY